MAADILIRPATLDDVADLAPRLREADRDEVWDSHRSTPEEALGRSLRLSTHAWAGLADGRLVCMWGVCPASMLDRIGVPWLLGSDEIETHQIAFLRRNRPMIAEMMETYTVLTNWVDARNTMSMRWLRWMGFTLFPAHPFGVAGLPFHRFEKRSS